MMEPRREFIDSYISDLQINLLNGGFTHCKPSWGYNDISPQYNKIYYICDGEGRIQIGDRQFFPKPGDIVFIPADVTHSFSTVSENTYTKYWCHFTSNVVFSPLFVHYGFPYFINSVPSNEIEGSFKNMVRNLDKSLPSYTLRIKAAIFEIISCFIDQCLSDHVEYVSPISIRKLHTLTQYIDNNLEKDIKIEDLAENVHFNYNYLFQYFKSHLGVTPMQYIYKRRLEKAKYLLTNTDQSLSEIALTTGFCDVFHFSKLFKKNFGISPKDFRNAHGN
jgi:AraC family transcriptional regulator of arabinose operon